MGETPMPPQGRVARATVVIYVVTPDDARPMISGSTSLASPALGHRAHLQTTLFIEAILSFACSFLFIGVFFYTAEVFHWDLVRNFLLASTQGAVYMVSALLSEKVARVVGRRRLLI